MGVAEKFNGKGMNILALAGVGYAFFALTLVFAAVAMKLQFIGFVLFLLYLSVLLVNSPKIYQELKKEYNKSN